MLILTAGLQVFGSWLIRADLDSWFTGVRQLAYRCCGEGHSRSQRTCIKGAHVCAKFKRFPERVMNHVRRNLKFKDRVEVLEFKEKKFVTNLLKGAKKKWANQKAECRRKVCDWLKVTYANEA